MIRYKILIPLCFLLTSSAMAQNTSLLSASANLNALCTISADNANFGEYIQDAPAAYSWGISQVAMVNVSVFCSNKQSYSIRGMPHISKAGKLGRFMKGSLPNNTDDVEYNVYINSCNGGARFGSGSVGGVQTFGINAVGIGAIKEHTLCFGIWPAKNYPGHWLTPDTYSESYTLTLTY